MLSVESNLIDMSSDAAAESLKDALHRLVEGDFQDKWEATKQLTAIGQAAIAHLTPMLADDDYEWEVRWFAARALGQFDHPEALKALVQLLQASQDPELIVVAAEGLSQFGESGIDALVQLLLQGEHRLTAVQALASMRHPSVMVPLLAASEDANPQVRATAIAALANFRDPQVDQVLLKTLKDANATVRQEAITHLGLRTNLLSQVNLVEKLLPGLWDLSLAVNQATAIALGRLGTETAIASLSRVLSSPHTPEPLQITLIQSLGWIEKETSVLALLSVRQRLSLSLQIEMVETLSRYQAPRLRQRAGDALCDWLKIELSANEPTAALVEAIALALGTLQHVPAIPLLTALTASGEHTRIQLYAQAGLRQLQTASAPDTKSDIS